MANGKKVHRDLRKHKKAAEAQGFRWQPTKEYWLVYPPQRTATCPHGVPAGQRCLQCDEPCRVAGTPSGGRSIANFLACLKRKGYRSN